MGRKILLAEDSSTVRKLFELAFARSDISLEMVDNGNDAVRVARETAPDLVIADVTLPDRDGFQVAEEISGSEKGRGCPVLILSGRLLPFDEEKFRKCGAKSVLFKPFDSRELADKVRELLSGAEESAPAEKEKPVTPPGGAWDFSDVNEEIGKAGGPRLSRAPEGDLSLGEFDISMEEIESTSSPAPGEISGKAREGAEPEALHVEADLLQDAPPAVTDIESALESVEEEEEAYKLEEVEQLGADAGTAGQEKSAFAAEGDPRDLFSGRAQEIFEKVAADTVEKVMWEFMERFSAEFSDRIRESVEAVAWEVIPPTAEALIREEIARIREMTEKKSS